MQELTEIRSPLENLQENSKRIQGWPQLGFKFFIESTDKHPVTLYRTSTQTRVGPTRICAGAKPQGEDYDYGCDS
jgi:hypothetical protein